MKIEIEKKIKIIRKNLYNILLWGFIIYMFIFTFIYLCLLFKSTFLLYILGYYLIFVIFIIVDKYFYWIYFNYKYYLEEKVVFLKKWGLIAYDSIFIIFLGILVLYFIYLNYFYLPLNYEHLEKISSFFTKSQIYKISILILILFFIRNILFFTRIILKYFATFTTLFFIMFLMIFSGSNYYLSYLGFNDYLGIIFSFVILFGMLKMSFLVNFDNYKRGYFFNIYKKVYNFIINSEKFKNDLKLLKNKKKKNKLIYKTYKDVIKKFNDKIIFKGNSIEPISDEPIGLGNDIFKNEDFAKNIYDLMNGINLKKFKNSYSIGIVGEWGGGKSSIINLLDEQFFDGNPNFKVLRFNPWDYKKDKLINNFFGELSKILGVKDISNLFKNYLNLLGNVDSSVKIGLDFLSGFIGKKSLEEVRNEINFKLKEFDRKIVVIIDDLDRCEPDEVLMILNLVKNLGDFNNIIYLVSYDKEHIIKVLDEKGFDKNYIEKIINIERFIPIPGKEELKKYFKKQFKEILKNIKKDNTELFDETKRQEITDFLISEFDEFFEKENLRFIKKLLNQLNVILQLNLEKEGSQINDLSNEDFKNIFIINYCKLKDYKLFNENIRIRNLIITNNGGSISNDLFIRNKEIYLINNIYIFNLLFKNIGLYNTGGNDINNSSFYVGYEPFGINDPDYNDLKEDIKTNIVLIKKYS